MHITIHDTIAPEIRTVLLNGIDVTPLAVELDTAEGWVKMLVAGVDGRILTDSADNPLTLQVYGRVVIGLRQQYHCSFCLAVLASPGTWAQHIKSHQFVPN